MDIEELARSMMARMPWEVGQKVLLLNHAPRGRGWENTVAKLVEHQVELNDAIEPLTHSLVEHNLCGEKLVRVYKIGPFKVSALRSALLGLTIQPSAFKVAYPGVLPDEGLEDIKPGNLTLVAVEEVDAAVAAVFASVRTIEQRVPLSPDELPEAVADALSAYDEVYGVKLTRMQAMDVVWVPQKGGYVDVHVDFPRGMSTEMGVVAHAAVREAINKKTGDAILENPENLFPLINVLYGSNEGRVVELKFGTTTASTKHERMRRAQTCLRKETYHKGGKAALSTPIEPYNLSIEWDKQLTGTVASHPELTLNGGARIASAPNPTLTEMVIRKCIGVDDFEYVRAKVSKHLKQIGSKAKLPTAT